jgi:hypothetical protein
LVVGWRELAAIAVLSAPALAAPPALAQGQPSNVLAGVLAPGRAEVGVGFGGFFYPRTSWPLRVEVHLRPRPSQRDLTAVWVRFKAPRARCARSFARDRGTSLGGVTRVSRTGGLLRFRTRRPHTWQRPGRVRFCVWPGPSRATRIRPVVQDVEFFGGLFGAALSPDPHGTGFRAAVASAVPFRDIAERSSRDPSCRSAPEIFDFVPPEYRPPLFLADGANNYVGCRDAQDFRTYTLLAEPSGQPVLRPQGSLSYTLADAHHHVIRHLGACVFERDLDNRRVAEAMAYIRAVGCRPGRRIAIPRAPDAFRLPSPGAVYSYYVHGGQAILVPRHTVVDMIVNR